MEREVHLRRFSLTSPQWASYTLSIRKIFNTKNNETLSHQDVKLFLYPVADELVTLDRSVPPAQLVRLYQALADERRLCILNLLTSRGYSFQELSDEFGVARMTMHHHLVLLRAAGLVNMRSNEKQHSLRPEAIGQASRLLENFLNNS